MKPQEIRYKIKQAADEQQFWQRILDNKSCNDCRHMIPNRGCDLAGGVMPPDDVQKTGCPEWAWDDVPF